MKLHPGPIVRINPWELSIHDREFYDEMYVSAGNRNTNGFPQFSKALDFGGMNFLKFMKVDRPNWEDGRFSLYDYLIQNSSIKKKTSGTLLFTSRRFETAAHAERDHPKA